MPPEEIRKKQDFKKNAVKKYGRNVARIPGRPPKNFQKESLMRQLENSLWKKSLKPEIFNKLSVSMACREYPLDLGALPLCIEWWINFSA